jgi:hypothetical protein
VAFHVEISHGLRRAREFNLDGRRLGLVVLEPWAQGRAIQMGDRDWDPAESDLTILEGPDLSGSDLAYGRGWDRALRVGRDVTKELLAGATREATAVAVHADSDSARDAIATALGELGLKCVDWAAIRGSSLAVGDEVSETRTAQAVAVILVVETDEPRREWLYEAGVAVGALGGRAVVARLAAAAAPPELAGIESVEPGDDPARALAAGLRRIGFR